MPGPSVDDVAAMLPVPNASGFQKGARLVVAYPLSDDPLLFRERVVLCRTTCGSYLLLTPDRSITCESAGKIQIRQVRRDGRVLGVESRDVYWMRDGPRGELEAGELDHWLEAGLTIATAVSTFAPAYGEDFINIADDVRGLIGGALSRYGQAVHDLHQSTDVAFSDGLITDALAKSGRLLKEKGWWFGASGGIFKIGDAVPPSMAVIGGESRGYVVLDGGGECVVWRGRHAALGADDEGDHKCVSRHVALRLFPIERDSSDIRGIDYNVCVYRCIGFKPVA